MLKFLIDKGSVRLEQLRDHPLIAGQLMTPLTSYRNWGGTFAIDNGAFTSFDREKFSRLVHAQDMSKCLFVAMPDVVGNARRTLEAFFFCMTGNLVPQNTPRALVAQDGIEDLSIPWAAMSAVFIGGSTEFKMSQAAADVIKTALIMGKHVHVGRLNTPDRYFHFNKLGAHTCDGSGIARYDWMLRNIEQRLQQADHHPLLDAIDHGTEEQTECI